VKEQAQAFLQHVEETGLESTIVMHDQDTKFTASFDEVLESADLEVKKAAHRSPNTVAFVERFIQTLQRECLDYLIVFGEQHMDHIVSEMVTHYHEERPHQSKENDPLLSAVPAVKATKTKRKKKDESPPDVIPVSRVECRQRLGGLLKHYYRKVA
jgi:putative transposase